MSLYNEKQKYLQNFKGIKSLESVCNGQPNKSSVQEKDFTKNFFHMGLTEEQKDNM